MLKNRQLILCIFALISFIPLYGQQPKTPKNKIKNKINNQRYWSVGYTGHQITHPGLTFSYERGFRTHEILKTKYVKRKDLIRKKRKLTEWIVAPSLGFWIHPKNTTGILLDTELKNRRTKSKGFQWNYGIGAGLLQQFRNGKTYVSNENHTDFEIKNLAGEMAFQTNIFIALGRNNTFVEKRNWNWEFKKKIMLQAPHGTGIRIHFFWMLNVYKPF